MNFINCMILLNRDRVLVSHKTIKSEDYITNKSRKYKEILFVKIGLQVEIFPNLVLSNPLDLLPFVRHFFKNNLSRSFRGRMYGLKTIASHQLSHRPIELRKNFTFAPSFTSNCSSIASIFSSSTAEPLFSSFWIFLRKIFQLWVHIQSTSSRSFLELTQLP